MQLSINARPDLRPSVWLTFLRKKKNVDDAAKAMPLACRNVKNNLPFGVCSAIGLPRLLLGSRR
jgi:hypothetical protein